MSDLGMSCELGGTTGYTGSSFVADSLLDEACYLVGEAMPLWRKGDLRILYCMINFSVDLKLLLKIMWLFF